MQDSRWMKLRLGWIACGISAIAAYAHADVLVVSASGSGQFTDLQTAVNAAANGDTLLVRGGAYNSFTVDGKALSITADSGVNVSVSGSIIVRNLSTEQSVVLVGLQVTGATTSSMDYTPGVGLYALGNSGALRVEACTLKGASGYGDLYCCVPYGHYRGWAGTMLDHNTGGVAFVRCTLQGGRASNTYKCIDCMQGGTGGAGGEGLLVQGTRVALYDSNVYGGTGGYAATHGGLGGAGCLLQTADLASALFASNTTIGGGTGGGGDDWAYNTGGNGGDGLVVEQFTLAQVLDSGLYGGPGGQALGAFHPMYDGLPGAPMSGAGQIFGFTGAHLSFNVQSPVREDTDVAVSFAGAPGEHVYLRIADGTGFRPSTPWKGVQLTSHSQSSMPFHQGILVLDVGTIPAGGSINTTLHFSDVTSAATSFMQAYSIDAQGHGKLGSFAAVSVIDSNY